MKNWADEQKYKIAEKLREAEQLLMAATAEAGMDCDESLIDALEDAMAILSPRYVADYAEELEKGMNSPEAKAFAKEAMKSPEAQAFIADIERQKRGEIALDYMKKKWGHGGK